MKLIIENRSDASHQVVLDLVSRVMDGGRVSNEGKQYCYATRFTVGIGDQENQYMVYTDLNKKSDRFVITPINRDGGE